MKPNILVQLLRDLHQELTTCLEFEPVNNVREPILLGDFIVDTYNTYLSHAKIIFEDPFIDKLEDIQYWDESQGGKEKHTKTAKMREILFATQTLITLLGQQTASQQDKVEHQFLGIMSLLSSLGKQINTPSKLDVTALNFLTTEYNRCLAMVVETIEDPFIDTLFQPIEASQDTTSTKMMLQFAHRSLQDYLKKLSRQNQLTKKDPAITVEDVIAHEIRGNQK